MRGNTQALAGVWIDCSVDSRSWVEIRRLLLVFALTAQWIPGRGWKYAGSCWCLHLLLSGFQVAGGNTQALAGVCIDCSVDSRSWVEIRRLLLVFALTAQWIPGRGWKYAGSC